MIITTKISALVSGRNKSHYEQLGYKLPYTKDSRGRIGIKKGTRVEVLFEHLHKFSQEKITYKCDVCGSIHEVSAQTIIGRKNSQYNKTGETLCQTCANKKMSGKNSGAYKHGSKRFSEYKNNARRRKIEFNITPDEFEFIVNQPCYYCGGYSKDRNPNSRGNGIDRKYSNIGYIYNNCVPCCATCNFIKNNMAYDDFIKHISNIYNNLLQKNEIQK